MSTSLHPVQTCSPAEAPALSYPAARSVAKQCGTNLPTAKVRREAASATYFPLPSYQNNASVPPSANPKKNVGRGVPDVSGDADPTTGYVTLVDGQSGVIGGTSAVAPLWAGLIALINQSIGKPVGFVNPLLYQSQSSDLNDISSGNNGAYKAKAGWDACTGLGSPIGTEIAAALGAPASSAMKTGS